MGRARHTSNWTASRIGLVLVALAMIVPALPAMATLDTEPFEETRVLCIYKGEKVYWGATTEACKSSDLLRELPADRVHLCIENGEKPEYSSNGGCGSGQTLHTVPDDGLLVLCVKNRKYGQVDKKRADVFYFDDPSDCDPPKYYGNYVTPAPPIAGDDAYTTDEDSLLTVTAQDGLLINDEDYITPVLSAHLVDDASVGSVVLGSDGSFSYDPRGLFDHLATDETATVTFTYVASDGELHSAPATVTITVTGINDAPVAVADLNEEFVTDQNTVLFTTPGVVFNDTDAENDTLIAELISPPSKGILELGDHLRFDPNGEFDRLDTTESEPVEFTYMAFDGTHHSNVVTSRVRVLGVNDAPVANDDALRTDENTELWIPVSFLLGNDTDVDLENLTAVDFGVGSPSSSFDASRADIDGMIIFDARSDFDGLHSGQTGQATITYRAFDGDARSAPATLRITVDGISPSVARDESADTYNNAPISIDVLANDDVNGGALVLLDQPDRGTATISGDQIVFDPNGEFNHLPTGGYAYTTFHYRLDHPAEGPSRTATVTVYVIGR